MNIQIYTFFQIVKCVMYVYLDLALGVSIFRVGVCGDSPTALPARRTVKAVGRRESGSRRRGESVAFNETPSAR